MVVCRGSWAGSCLTDSLGACVCCCVRGAGVTDARGCSAQLRGRGSSFATVTLSEVLHSHTQSACGSYSSKRRKGGKRGGGVMNPVGGGEHRSRCSWWRQEKHVFSHQGLGRLQRPDLSGSSAAGFKKKLQLLTVKEKDSSPFCMALSIHRHRHSQTVSLFFYFSCGLMRVEKEADA